MTNKIDSAETFSLPAGHRVLVSTELPICDLVEERFRLAHLRETTTVYRDAILTVLLQPPIIPEIVSTRVKVDQLLLKTGLGALNGIITDSGFLHGWIATKIHNDEMEDPHFLLGRPLFLVRSESMSLREILPALGIAAPSINPEQLEHNSGTIWQEQFIRLLRQKV